MLVVVVALDEAAEHQLHTRSVPCSILERPVIQKILDHLGLDPQPPPKGRAHEPREPESHFAA